MSERERRYWGPYPGEVPLSRASRPAPPPDPEQPPDREQQPDPTPTAPPDSTAGQEPVAEPEPARAERPNPPERVVRPEPVTGARPEPPAAPDPSSGTEVPVHVADRAPSRAERRRDGNVMVPLLAQALSTQLAKLATDVDPVPDGWWFTPQR